MNDLKRKKKTRRDFKRLSARPRVTITCHRKGNEGANLTSAVLDLSQAGARLLVTAPLEVGEKVVLGVQGPSCPRALTLAGTVVWTLKVSTSGYAVGIRLKEHLGCDAIEQVTIHPVRLDY
jgi:Tfp pilus assembly protein PilZ